MPSRPIRTEDDTRGASTEAAHLATDSAGRLIERFMPRADHRARHETVVRAPADLVFDTACDFDLQSRPLVRAIFRLRELVFRSAPSLPRRPMGIMEETTSLGWRALAHRPGRELIMGAATRPWEANVVFRPVPPADFATFAEPGMVKIAWTLEAEPLGPARTRFRTETRVLATDGFARKKFDRYWRVVAIGILLIRMLLLPAVRREAERRFRLEHSRG
jgi:hypothetical protein